MSAEGEPPRCAFPRSCWSHRSCAPALGFPRQADDRPCFAGHRSCRLLRPRRSSDRKQGTGGRLGDPSPCLVLVQGTLKRTHEHVALSAVVENHAQAGIRAPLVGDCRLTLFSNIGFLSADDEERALSRSQPSSRKVAFRADRYPAPSAPAQRAA